MSLLEIEWIHHSLSTPNYFGGKPLQCAYHFWNICYDLNVFNYRLDGCLAFITATQGKEKEGGRRVCVFSVCVLQWLYVLPYACKCVFLCVCVCLFCVCVQLYLFLCVLFFTTVSKYVYVCSRKRETGGGIKREWVKGGEGEREGGQIADKGGLCQTIA